MRKIVIGLVAISLLTGCISLDHYDEWQAGVYETEKAELERFEEIRTSYKYIVDFNTPTDSNFIKEKSVEGNIVDGVYNFKHNGGSQFAHYLIDLDKLTKLVSGKLKRIAILVKTSNGEKGFVEIWPGDDLEGGNPNSVNNSGVTEGVWSLIEFIAEGNNTRVIGGDYFRRNNRNTMCFI